MRESTRVSSAQRRKEEGREEEKEEEEEGALMTRARRDTDANFHAQFGYRSAAHASGRFGG